MTTESDSFHPLGQAGAAHALAMFTIAPGKQISVTALKELLPDVETALFFAKAYKFDYAKLSELISTLFSSDVIDALLMEGGSHSTELQNYIIDTVPPGVYQMAPGSIQYGDEQDPPDTELLGQAVEAALVEIAESIQTIADKIGSVLQHMPSKYGQMTFSHLRKFNTQRAALGTYEAQIQHEATPPRLVIFDVSGSMSAEVVERIVDEVVGLAYEVNASLAIVSNDTFFWNAGAFHTRDVLDAAQYGGTHYETLVPVLDQDWATVITIADYDSSAAASDYIRSHAKGQIGEVIDVSLVNRPTYLAECVGQLAGKVTPILVSNTRHAIGSRWANAYG